MPERNPSASFSPSLVSEMEVVVTAVAVAVGAHADAAPDPII